MSAHTIQPFNPSTRPVAPSRTGLVAIYLFSASVVIRILADSDTYTRATEYVWLIIAHLVLYTLLFLRLRHPVWLLHTYFALQSVLLIRMLSLNPEVDIVTAFFIPLSYQVGLSFSGAPLTAWIVALAIFICAPLSYYFGWFEGLATTMTTIGGVIVVPAYVEVVQEIEAARLRSQSMVSELQQAHLQLEAYAAEVDELAAIEARNRLASELHDTVSQLLFSIVLTTRSAQLVAERDQQRLPELLEQLKSMTGEALSQLRSLITQMRPPQAAG